MLAWDKFLAVQEAVLGKDVVNNWLRPLKVTRYDACNLFLEASDSFQVMWFEEHVRPKLKHSLFNHNNTPIKVHLNVGGDSQNQTRKKSRKEVKEAAAEHLSASWELTFDSPDPLCQLDNFVVCEGNQLAYKLLTEVCQSAQAPNGDTLVKLGTYNPIYLYGYGGSGKTHLLSAAMHSLKQAGLRVIYARAETFTDHVVNAIRSGEMHLFRQAYRNTDVLILDDVHVFSRKSATQEELFHTFNTLHTAGKQIILAADAPPGELKHIEPRLISRFEWGIVLEVGSLTTKEMRDFLQNKCDALNYPLNPRTADYLLETFTSGTKAITKAIEALVFRTHISPSFSGHLSSTALSVNQARLYLSDLIKIEQEGVLTPEKILRYVSDHFGIRKEDILGKSQSRECSLPRQLSAYLCRELLKMPFKKIGDLFDRDHSTIMTSVKQVQKAIDENVSEVIAPLKAIRTAIKRSVHSNTASNDEAHASLQEARS